jgi:TPR repeat protein
MMRFSGSSTALRPTRWLLAALAVFGATFVGLLRAAETSAAAQKWPTRTEILARWGDKEWDEVRRAAEGGDSEARHYLGTCLANGDRITADPAAAKNWFQKASDAGFMPSTANLGVLHLRGLGVTKDQDEAQRLFRIAAEGGVAHAQYNLGWFLLEPPGTNTAEGLTWYRRAADQGFVQAIVALGRCYRFGTHVPKDIKAATEWFSKAADTEDPLGLVNLGWIFGYESPRDPERAVSLYERAAAKGQADAMYELFLAYRDGNGVPEEFTTALRWIEASAHADHPAGQALFGYWCETNSPSNMPEAVRWYRKAADLSDPDGCIELAELYSRGIGTPRNLEDRPIPLLQRSAAFGHVRAKRILARRYHINPGSPQ